MGNVWAYWYFHVPNFILAALVYTFMGRLALSFFVPDHWDNYIWRAFKRLTEPVLVVVRFVTPSILPNVVVLVFSILWLMVARVAFAMGLGALGLLPPAGGA